MKTHGECARVAPVKGSVGKYQQKPPGKLGGYARQSGSSILNGRYKPNPEKRKISSHIRYSLYSSTTMSSALAPSTDKSLISAVPEIWDIAWDMETKSVSMENDA